MSFDYMFRPGGSSSTSGTPLGINYIGNPSATNDVSGWSTYADAAGSSPVDGTGGSPTVTWSRSTTTPLRGAADFNLVKDAANRQGEGVGYAFTIDSADKGKVLNISFDYEVVSGTYADSDLTVYIYDVTNAAVIQPNGYTIQNASVPMKQIATFQTSTSSTSYRFIIHCASTSASAYTLAFDNFLLGPATIVNGAPITDEKAYTPTGNWSANTSYSATWRRVGELAEVNLVVSLTGAPTGNMTFTSAQIFNGTGLSLDTTKLEIISGNMSRALGSGTVFDSGTTSYVCSAYWSQADSVIYVTTAANNIISATNPITFANGDRVVLRLYLPVSGWSSNVQMSSDTDTRVTAFSGYVISHALTADTTLITLTADKDTHGGWSTNTYTVKVPGDYVIGATILSSSGAGSVYVVKNGSKHKYLSSCNTVYYSGGSVYMPSLVAGDTISFKSDTNITITGTTVGGGVTSAFHITRISGPSQIAATEKILAKATGDAASASSGNPVIIPTLVYDTHGAYNVSTGRYTCPAAGYYRVSGFINSGNTGILITIYKNAASDTQAGHTNTNGEATFTGTVSCVAGDILDIRPNGTLDADVGTVIHFERL